MTVVQVSHALVMLSCISHSSEYNIFVLYIIYNYMHVCVGHGKECQLVIHVYTCAVAYPGGGGGGGESGCSNGSNTPLSANSLIIHTVRFDLRLARGMSGSQ